jgi:hypothetical protein
MFRRFWMGPEATTSTTRQLLRGEREGDTTDISSGRRHNTAGGRQYFRDGTRADGQTFDELKVSSQPAEFRKSFHDQPSVCVCVYVCAGGIMLQKLFSA